MCVDTNNNSSSNSSVSRNNPITLDVDIRSGVYLDELQLYIDTSESGYTCDVYLNNNKVVNGERLTIATSSYSAYVVINGVEVGKNTIKVDLIKNGKVVKTNIKTYTLDYSKIPTPKLDVSKTYNTYDERYEITIWDDKNGCYGTKCKLELYVNGVKQSSTSLYYANLKIGDNVFKIELKNLYGKTACKQVTVKRFKYNPDVNFTKLGFIEIEECT